MDEIVIIIDGCPRALYVGIREYFGIDRVSYSLLDESPRISVAISRHHICF